MININSLFGEKNDYFNSEKIKDKKQIDEQWKKIVVEKTPSEVIDEIAKSDEKLIF